MRAATFRPSSGCSRHGWPAPRIQDRWSAREGRRFPGKARGRERAAPLLCAPIHRPQIEPGTLPPDALVFPRRRTRRLIEPGSPAGLSQPSSAIRKGPSITRKPSSHSSRSLPSAGSASELHRLVDVAEAPRRRPILAAARSAASAPVRERTVDYVCFRIVVRQQFGLGSDDLGEPACEHLGDALVQLALPRLSRPTDRPRREISACLKM